MTRRGGRDMREGMRGTANGRATTALALALMAGPAAAPAEAEPRGPVRAAADIAPVHSLVAMVMRDAGSPALIVPPGASPHGYALRPSQARALQEAEIVFRIGPGLTPWLEEALEEGALVDLVARFEAGRFSSRDVLALIVAGLRGGGWQGGPRDLVRAEIAGGPMGAARAAAELLARAFMLPEAQER